MRRYGSDQQEDPALDEEEKKCQPQKCFILLFLMVFIGGAIFLLGNLYAPGFSRADTLENRSCSLCVSAYWISSAAVCGLSHFLSQ